MTKYVLFIYYLNHINKQFNQQSLSLTNTNILILLFLISLSLFSISSEKCAYFVRFHSDWLAAST